LKFNCWMDYFEYCHLIFRSTVLVISIHKMLFPNFSSKKKILAK
jgi:hypothetical protein